jgi:hypothetical protein
MISMVYRLGRFTLDKLREHRNTSEQRVSITINGLGLPPVGPHNHDRAPLARTEIPRPLAEASQENGNQRKDEALPGPAAPLELHWSAGHRGRCFAEEPPVGIGHRQAEQRSQKHES